MHEENDKTINTMERFDEKWCRCKGILCKIEKIDGTQILNKEHCEKVAKLAEKYGKVFACRDEARVAGYMHDFGNIVIVFRGC